MKSVIFWLGWMVYWIFLATGTPSFFPDWLQAVIWAIGGTGAVLLIGWAKHVEVLNTRITAKDEDIKRLEAQNTDLEKQLQKEPITRPQALLNPVSLGEVSEIEEKTPKLLPPILGEHVLSQNELKVQALQTANKIYKAIEDAQESAPLVVPKSVLNYYNNELHDIAVNSKLGIHTPWELTFFPTGKYTNPKTWEDLKDIALDLRKIASSPKEVY